MDDASPQPSACPQCGTTMPADATGGVCPRCLLREALQTEPVPFPAEGEGPTVSVPAEAWNSAATIRVSAPTPSLIPARWQADLPLPEELTEMLPQGAYLVDDFLGQGGMGAVYRGVQVRLKREVAIKIMRRDHGKDMDFEARFEREAQAMAKLNHPNIVSVIDFGEAGTEYLYIVMELVDGADLMNVIRAGQMTQEMALSLLPQICDALQFAHDHGIVHRDIKPSNIMLTRDGRIKMADFGLAKLYDAEDSFRTQTGTGMGTPDYAAPEQFDPAASIDHRADIYALGVMIYQMITGQLPRGAWKAPSLRAEVDPHWDEIVSRAMQSDPQDRYQQASEVKTDVSCILLMQKSRPAPARPSDKAGAATQKTDAAGNGAASAKSRSRLLFSLLGCAAVLAIGAYFVTQKKGDAINPTSAAAKPATALIESRWKPLFTEAELAAVKPPQEYKDGALRVYESKTRTLPSVDGALRAKVIYRNGASNIGLGARMTSASSAYQLRIGDQGGASLEYLDGASRQMSKLATAPFQALNEGVVVQMELRIEGRHLTGLINGQKILEADDDHLPSPGKWGVLGDAVWFQSIEVQPLPVPGTTVAASSNPAVASSSVAAASTGSPFTNTLGMKFVPVPGTKALFSLWDTRVRDYAAYAAANPQADGSWKAQNKDGEPVGHEPDHPVVGVSWEDAQAFCQWLTQKETAERKLPAGQRYRLPTDQEWSIAAGLPPEQGATPEARYASSHADFPWGKDWPPRQQVGNYADEAYHAKFPPKKNEKDGKMENDKWTQGYTDGFATTSPVGSFPANAQGLYDMGGNVWQWCEDWWNAEQKHRVLRGGSWGVGDREGARASFRHHYPSSQRFPIQGFRCVLESGPVSVPSVSPEGK